MKNELFKLNIQFFADDGTTTVDTAALDNLGKSAEEIGNSIDESLKKIMQTINDLYNNAGLASEAGESLNEAANGIKPFFEKYRTSIANLGNFLVNLAAAFLSADSQMNSEITQWGTTVKTVVSQFNEGINSQAAQGSYDTTTYVNDLKKSAISISGATRTIVNETATMFGNSGKYLKSTTGKNLLEIGEDVTNHAIGTVKTLFGYANDNSSSSIVTSIFNTLGKGVSEFANLLNS